jgi:hypothetical protein
VNVPDMTALLRSQPASGLAPELMGIILGFSAGIKDWPPYEPDSIWLLEPPAGRGELWLDPLGSMSVIFRYLGESAEAAQARAFDEWTTLQGQLVATDKLRFYDFMRPDSPRCTPARALSRFLRAGGFVPAWLIDFLDDAIASVEAETRFTGADAQGVPWRLSSLPRLPPPPAMIELVPAAGWEYEGEILATTRRFAAWRASMRPVAARLEAELGESVYHFADRGIDTDDDHMHRFLLLHWLCSFLPSSAYVRFLVEASGATDVENLKSALLDPASYTQPFKMHDAFFSLTACTMRIDLPAAGRPAIIAET